MSASYKIEHGMLRLFIDHNTVAVPIEDLADAVVLLNRVSGRDQFAMAALTGIIASCNEYECSDVAHVAYRMADAMLEARK